jgi:RHS repeat-associated protein
MSKGSEIWAFEYNANGLRTKRCYNDRIYNYVYSGSQLTAMVYSWHKFYFTYDATGKPLTLEYHDTFGCQMHNGGSCGPSCETYYYVTNLQGDVIALLDSSGNKVAEYTYDAWGNHVKTPSSFIGNYNPLRYRGYVYDRETKLYYLQSRYYNPEIGRYIQQIDISTINQSNTISHTNSILSGVSATFSSSLSLPNPASNMSSSETSNEGIWGDAHWENDFWVTDWPDFLVLSRDGFEAISWGLSIYSGTLYFDENEQHSLYVSAGNIGIFAGFVFPKDKTKDNKTRIGFDASASVLEVGYDGRIIDVSVSALTVGATYLLKDGKFKWGFNYGWIGVSVLSILLK